MNILLVGGNRFVGVEIAWQLLRVGHELTILALDPPPADIRPHIRWLTADRNNEDGLKELFKDSAFDAVIDNIAFEPYQVEILCRVFQGRIGRYLLTSTTDVYPGNFPRTYTEDQVDIQNFDLTGLVDAPRYMYGKRSCEAALRNSGIPWTVVRPCIVTGPRDNRNGAPAARQTHWFETTARSHFWPSRVLDGGPILMCREDEGTLQLVWVGDVARAVTGLISDEQAVDQAYNLTGSEIWTNERLVRALATAAGRTPDIVHVSRRLIEESGIDYSPVYGTGAYWSLADNAKLRTTGWSPTPAEKWLPFLLEELPPPISRPWYHTRLQEIALAQHIKRRQSVRPSLPPSTQRVEPIWPMTADAASQAAAPLSGRATAEQTAGWKKTVCSQYAAVKPQEASFKTFNGLTVSGIGIGTWMGALSSDVDHQYIETMTHAGCRGINVFDTAINYRHMKAERCVGAALRRLESAGLSRNNFFVSSKGGYVSHDADDRRHADEYLRQEYVGTGLLSEDELSRRHAALNPRFIAQQIDQSLHNMGLETIDLYYLHNPEEATCLLETDQLFQRLVELFAVLEGTVRAGKIGCYGLATWDGLRVAPSDAKHLPLELACAAAGAAAGSERHHLAAVQMPFNPVMHEAYTTATQSVKGQLYPALVAAGKLGLYTFTSASVMQGGSINEETKAKFTAESKGLSLPSSVLQSVRGCPAVGTALAGMRQIAHVEDAIAALSIVVKDVFSS
jgi:aryl-alcohol dehydrogenase-like predicted oxidoreductase/nucleoside-diphosphate-sugar epimerase